MWDLLEGRTTWDQRETQREETYLIDCVITIMIVSKDLLRFVDEFVLELLDFSYRLLR